MLTASVSSSTSSTSSTSGTTSTAPTNTLDQNAFLNLLVTQLQHQDPTNAQDPNAMVSEMATFSSLEAQQNTNTLLASIQTQNAALYQAQSADLIGKSIQVTTGNVSLADGTADIGVNLASNGNAILAIKNASGVTVRTLGPGALSAGDNTVQWDGKDSAGNQLPDGAYTVSVAAQSSTGTAITAYTTASAVVTDVSFVNNQVMVTAGGNQYALSSINDISQ